MADSSVWIDVWHRLTPGFRGQPRIKISGHSQPNLAWDTYKVAAPTEKLKSHTPGNPSGPAVIEPDDQSVNMPTQQPTPSAPPRKPHEASDWVPDGCSLGQNQAPENKPQLLINQTVGATAQPNH